MVRGQGGRGEAELCEQTRKVVDGVDWPCEVKTLYQQENLGCRRAVSTAITWFFDNVDAGIVLEDDCLPAESFFRFCSELLVRYRDDMRVGMISGNNHGFKLYDSSLSYSFSKHGAIWGWASWRRAWARYDACTRPLSSKDEELVKRNISTHREYVDRWWQEAEKSIRGELDSWDFLWAVTRYSNSFLSIRPKVDLVSNIGFGEEATHTKGPGDKRYKIARQMEFPLVHPAVVIPDCVADDLFEAYRTKSFGLQRSAKIRRWIISTAKKHIGGPGHKQRGNTKQPG